jgi:DNA-directed RNA polymerase subunit RPC12/RpoP
MSPYKSTDATAIEPDERPAPLFRNFYKCADCGKKWTDDWPAMCDDDCPHCGARHMSPYKSREISKAAEESSHKPHA